jgi:hypothetical protein
MLYSLPLAGFADTFIMLYRGPQLKRHRANPGYVMRPGAKKV